MQKLKKFLCFTAKELKTSFFKIFITINHLYLQPKPLFCMHAIAQHRHKLTKQKIINIYSARRKINIKTMKYY